MKTELNSTLKSAAAVLLAVVLGIGGLLIGLTIGAPHEQHDHHGATTYTCSMHPEVRSDEPGTCPICGMALTPAAAAADPDDTNAVTLSERARTLARIQTTPVSSRAVADALSLLGRVEADETRTRTITAWASGRIDRLHVATTGEKIRKGQTIATMYSPEIYAAHRDLIYATQQLAKLGTEMEFARASAEATVAAAEQKLRLLGVSSADLAQMAKETEPRTQVRVRANHAGTVIERALDEGAYVEPGTPIYRVADLSKVWVQLDAYEADLAALHVGQAVELTVEALPGRDFQGEVVFIDPVVDPRQRTTRVRVELSNDGALRPGMFARATVRATAEDALSVPRSAPLFLGDRAVVFVATDAKDEHGHHDVRYEPRDVVLGARTGEHYPVLEGLREGEAVVTHGAFAIDADLQIRGGKALMSGAY